MSKNILFRGQTRKKGEKVTMSGTPIPSNWVFGGIFPQNNGGDFAIIYQQDPEIQKFPVPSTVSISIPRFRLQKSGQRKCKS